MKKVAVVLFLVLFVVLSMGMPSYAESQAEKEKMLSLAKEKKALAQEAQEAVSTMTYVMDYRTGLCFGIIRNKTYYNSPVYSYSLTLVPCNEDVMKQIGK